MLCLCLGLRCALTPPVLAGVQGVCVWAQVSALPRHSWLGFVVGAFGVWFCGGPAIPRWGLGCVCFVTGFSCAPPFLAGVCGVCVWIRVLRARCYFWLGCWGMCSFARAPSVPRHPLVGPPVAWDCVGVAVGGVSPPPSFFHFSRSGCAGGGVLWVWFSALLCSGSLVVAVACLGPGPLGLRPPAPFRLGFVFFFSVSVWPAARNFSGWVCAGVSGVLFSPCLRRPCGRGGPLLLGGRRRAGRGGPPDQPDRSINPIFRSHLVENHERQLLTRVETLSQRKKKIKSPCAYLFIVPNAIPWASDPYTYLIALP